MKVKASLHQSLAKVTAVATLSVLVAVSVSLMPPVPGMAVEDTSSANTTRIHAPWPEDLLRTCTSVDPAASAYCDGYLGSAMNFWKVVTACQSGASADRSYCAGAKAATAQMRKVSEDCGDCDRSKPQYLAEMKKAAGTCVPDASRDRNYCDGYNGIVERELAMVMGLWKSGSPAEPTMMGRMDAESDLGMAMFGSEVMASFQPCVSLATRVNEVRGIVVDFISKHPGPPPDTEGNGRLISFETVARALYIGLCPGPGLLVPPTGRESPHWEVCTHIAFYRGDYHTENVCSADVAFAFSSTSATGERTLKPGEAFQAGLKPGQEKGFLFTTCPVGFTSSIPIVGEGSRYHELRYGQYKCVRR